MDLGGISTRFQIRRHGFHYPGSLDYDQDSYTLSLYSYAGLSVTCNGRGSNQLTSSMFHKGTWQSKKATKNCNAGFDHAAMSMSTDQVRIDQDTLGSSQYHLVDLVSCPGHHTAVFPVSWRKWLGGIQDQQGARAKATERPRGLQR